jgi:hypothetical protein
MSDVLDGLKRFNWKSFRVVLPLFLVLLLEERGLKRDLNLLFGLKIKMPLLIYNMH